MKTLTSALLGTTALAIMALGGATPAQARSDIEARLLALSRAHDLLTRQNWEGASIAEVVSQAVEPFDSATTARFPGVVRRRATGATRP